MTVFSFPETKFVDELKIAGQFCHLASEVDEVFQDMMNERYLEMASELWDVIHSAETALRILEKDHQIDVKGLKQKIIDKNKQRGYYK